MFENFKKIVDDVLSFFKEKSEEYEQNALHVLSNMALLGGIENSKLNNSVFEVNTISQAP